jgi:hypothetical protein
MCKKALSENSGFFDYLKEGYNAAKTIFTNSGNIAKLGLEEINLMVKMIGSEFKIGILQIARLTRFSVKLLRLYHNSSIDQAEKVIKYGKYISTIFKTVIKLGYSAKRVIVFIVHKFISSFLMINDFLFTSNVAQYLYNYYLSFISK